ncbi:hypothetical protein HPB52_008877 [Rhipicephalus sanguineus]|uniref:FMN hydroxy acid dehydrogenase domain-containing protein n=1 Tax=Rhipicephalus sanguineus TaxID=34632 RepID=A0A9D4PVD1_RHISA|nr:hypothetical protein HPB52_008877 [Rhipicephalus sanguineus]
MVLSALSTTSMEDVASAAPGGVRWLQMEVVKDRSVTIDFLTRAERIGYGAIVLTVDMPVFGLRVSTVKNRMTYPEHLCLANFEGTNYSHIKDLKESCLEQLRQSFDRSLTWDALAWIKSVTKLPVVVKGILTAEDACEAVNHGASAILVSNHGGRQLDGVPATHLVTRAPNSSSLGDLDVTAPLGLGTMSIQKPDESKTITNVSGEPSELTHPQLQAHSLPECADGHLALNETKDVVSTTFTRCTDLKDSSTCLCEMVTAAALKGKGSQYLTTDHQRLDGMEYNVSNTKVFSKKVSREDCMKVSPSLFPLPGDGISITKKRALDFTTTATEESPRPLPETSGVNENESERSVDSVETSAVEENISIPTKPQKVPDEGPDRFPGVDNHGVLTEKKHRGTLPATIEVLATIVRAVRGRCEVYLDGGVRRGTDVIKALALGARAVFIGRPIIWGLAYDS